MDVLKVQKQIAKEVLEELEVIDPFCILAGGAPRDWFFGKVAADLDFYVYDSANLSQSVWTERLSKTLLDVKPLGLIEGKSNEELDHEYTAMKHLRYVFEGEYMGATIQVMVMSESTFHSVVDNFCMDNSKVWWKGGKVNTTPEFLLANATRTLRVCPEHTPKQRYIDKMMEKFPTYKLVETNLGYAIRTSKFKEVAQASTDYELLKMWWNITESADKENVQSPYFLGW
ncbi:coil containing protein [Vibrio phage 409E50-1]|nr:coil containing protein [Vibrio phage 521E56-1]CAH9012116.1 coil containing protein [Vibrio phage 384E50-1]CAH9012140.1 coil containing protein [Vibrio phage 402E50-1]CAH9012144.1 coil containing protein [Vibrio phage 409E50-1]CAH9013355.1 coil containing protein [Vibrio phage 405E50-1]CAH9013410.1 coil containing protein [Vibrio phage 413E50-1]